ncbi:MAG: tetratricopeptide repeat protein [Desulfobacterium sp.]|nr:tetratricopeptide repeat protein [Desulfobacterium sp.]
MTDSDIHTLELGRVYEEQGYLKKAADHFSGALKNDPENSILIKSLDRINTKRSDPTDPIDRSSLSGIIEQWVYLVVLRQRAARLFHTWER